MQIFYFCFPRSMDTGMNEINKTPSKGGAGADWFATPSNRAPLTPGKGSSSSKKVSKVFLILRFFRFF